MPWAIMVCASFYLIKLMLPMLILSCGCLPHQSTASEQCNIRQPPSNRGQMKDHGGLTPLLMSANSTRSGIVAEKLPFQAIRREISKVYNVSALNRWQFVGIWIDYSQNTIYVSGFAVFVGLLLPAVMVALWTFWECCYEEDEEEDEDNRNLTLSAQVFAWSLTVSLVVVLICLIVFVGILLAGSGWITAGVHEGSKAMNSTLPEFVRIRDESLSKVNRILVTNYNNLLQQLYETTLEPVASNVRARIHGNFSYRVGYLAANVSMEMAARVNLSLHAVALSQNLLFLEDVQAAIEPVQESVMALVDECTQVTRLNVSLISDDLQSQCELLTNNDSYVPRILVDISSLREAGGEQRLARVVELLGDTVSWPPDTRNGNFEAFLDMVTNLSSRVSAVSDSYLDSFGQHLNQFSHNMTQSYNFSFNYPHSQEQLAEHLGPRQLQNWDWFRSSLTVTFALCILFAMLCLLVAVTRGLYNVVAIYRNGDDTTYIEGAHQAGTMTKKLAIGFCAVCVVCAIAVGYFISMAGVMGRGCGPQNNFSSIVEHVIDDTRTWRGEYPLGRMVLQNSLHPLTFQLVLDGCHRNESLFVVLQLASRHNLTRIITVDAARMTGYIAEMRSISQTVGDLSLFPPTIKSQLQLLHNVSSLHVQWDNFTSLSADSLFQEGFAGMNSLVDLLTAMRVAAASLPGLEAHTNISSLVVQALGHLQALGRLQNNTAAVESVLPSIRFSASYLQTTLADSRSGRLLNQTADLESTIKVETITASHRELVSAAVRVNNALTNYTTSARHTLQCKTGFCLSLAEKYDQFASAVCNDVVPGMDVYWISLVLLLITSFLTALLSFLLASRFIDLDKKAKRSAKFHLTSAIIRQLRALFWLVLSISINLWLVVYIKRDEYFHTQYCLEAAATCCVTCVWAFGALFVALAIAVGGLTHMYQCINVYRIHKWEAMKVRRVWIDRNKTAQFYGQLGQLVVQDVSFLVLAGTYANGAGFLNVPAFFSIVISLLGIISYFIYLIRERENISGYFLWLKGQAGQLWSKVTNQKPVQGGRQAHPTHSRNRRVGGRSPHGSSESEQSEDGSQGTAQNDPNFIFVPHHEPVSHRLSVIPEQAENTLDRVTAVDPVIMTTELDPRAHEDMHTETDLSQPQQTVMLDRPVDSGDEALRERMHFITHVQGTRGVEIAAAYRHRRTECETSTTRSDSMMFGSKDSISTSERYYSSSQPDHYESSDYREDCDCESDYSQQSRYLNGIIGEMSMEV